MRLHTIAAWLLVAACAWASEPDSEGLQTGIHTVTWKSSSSNCMTTPDDQVHA